MQNATLESGWRGAAARNTDHDVQNWMRRPTLNGIVACQNMNLSRGGLEPSSVDRKDRTVEQETLGRA